MSERPVRPKRYQDPFAVGAAIAVVLLGSLGMAFRDYNRNIAIGIWAGALVLGIVLFYMSSQRIKAKQEAAEAEYARQMEIAQYAAAEAEAKRRAAQGGPSKAASRRRSAPPTPRRLHKKSGSTGGGSTAAGSADPEPQNS